MPMRKVDAKSLGDFVERLLNQGRYRRLIRGRFFRATVSSVSGVAAPFLVGLIRNGESTPDGGSYACATPGYTPAVGHDVLCVWIDESNAVVLWKMR